RFRSERTLYPRDLQSRKSLKEERMYPRNKRRGRLRFLAVLPLAAACALALPTLAGAEAPSVRPKPLTPAAAGRFERPTPAEVQEFLLGLAPFFAKAQERPVAKQAGGANGTPATPAMAALDLSGRFASTAIATTQADGSLTWTCVNSLDEAFLVLTDP